MSLARLVLVRHGETDFNAEGRMQGHLDSELTELGKAQIRMAAPVLAGYDPVRLVSSDLSRAARTAEHVGETCGLPVKLDPRLRETHLGAWQGLTLDDVEQGWPGLLASWRADPEWAPPGGESRVAVAARVLPLVDELVEELAEGSSRTVLLFTHGGLIASLTCALMGLPAPTWTALSGPGNCRWTVLRRRVPNWRLASHNVGCEPLP
ncbi:MAG: histidine phosphatase family protein [Actinomycetota bacterium]|nr:histidine phosphatase family protein [Actinomycetota bacterium]